jgi:hypothetical protein
MGSPLGPTFAEYYMCNVENNVLADDNLKPSTYCRYVDDIYVVVRNEDHLIQLKNKMQDESVLNFTHEMSVNSTLPFLDVEVKLVNNEYRTTVHRKPTNADTCLNSMSECPNRYKLSVIRSYVHRAHKICNDEPSLKSELARSKQILINNGYSNTQVDAVIKKYRPPTSNNPTANDMTGRTHKVYYCNQMSDAFKTDERILQDIVFKNTKCRAPEDRLSLVIYYKNDKTTQLLIRNNPASKPRNLQQTNVVYKFSCPYEDCKLQNNVSYIGLTTTTLSRRLTCHLSSGGPKTHFQLIHDAPLTRTILEENTKIINHQRDPTRLAIAEALIIVTSAPAINLQCAAFTRTLKLFGN